MRHDLFEEGHWLMNCDFMRSSSLGSSVYRLVDAYDPWVITGMSALVMYGVFRRGYTGTH